MFADRVRAMSAPHWLALFGLILLVAMVGAIVLTLRHRADIKRQDVLAQTVYGTRVSRMIGDIL